jgi:hypothetical protein
MISLCTPKPTFTALAPAILHTFRAPGELARAVWAAAKDLAVEKAMAEA